MLYMSLLSCYDEIKGQSWKIFGTKDFVSEFGSKGFYVGVTFQWFKDYKQKPMCELNLFQLDRDNFLCEGGIQLFQSTLCKLNQILIDSCCMFNKM